MSVTTNSAVIAPTAAHDVVVVKPCGYDLAKVRAEMESLTQHPQWRRLPAVSAGRVYLVDGNAYFNRPGPRLLDSLEIMAEMLHPEIYDFGHGGPNSRKWCVAETLR